MAVNSGGYDVATSGKNSKSSKAGSTGAEKASGKQASTSPVIKSSPVEPGQTVVSRIPPSVPIESTLVGATETPIPAASARGDDRNAAIGSAPEVSGKTVNDGKADPGASAAKPTATKPAQTAPVVVRKGGFWPMALGGAVAAGIGAAAAIWAMPHLSAADADAPAVDPAAIRSDAVAAATEAGASAGTEAAQSAIAALPADGGDTSALQAELTAQADKIAALEARLAAPSDGAGEASTADASADLNNEIGALRQVIDTQGRQIEELLARPQMDPQTLDRVQSLAQSADQVKAEIESAAADARQSLDAVQQEAQAATQRARVVASVATLSASLEHGQSADEAVEQLESAGVEVPAPLAQEDLPTLVQIQMGFDAVARAALKESLKAESRDGGAMTAVGNFLRVQTGARSVEPREGDDPDAVLSRAGALVEQGEIATALEEIAALPPEGQRAIADWKAQAQAYLDAEAALHDVATTLN
ncbi:MAG: hypothetical protein DI616_10260 [Paracoccus denitrificans]|uniref:Mitochondrial inner membrane protein n=1 Tax=Paracoccus denitrificans TaxID=266 RepID=A0A533I445_PARDE|nr:MAG: hypothetical protein DI616_10260 [Paracoccus denitrificans]